MKKFYTLLAAAMMTVAANAQMYICGEMATWDAATAKEMPKNADGSYSYKYTANGNAQEFTISTKQGGWDAPDGWKANALTCTPENGKFVVLTKGSTNMKTPRYKSGTEATITVSADRRELKIEGTLNEAPVTLKFFGDLNGAGSWTEYDLTDGKYVLTVTSTCYFTFTTGSWGGAWRPDNGETPVDKDGTYSANGNNDKVFYIETAGTYTLTPNAATKTFTVTGFGDEPGPGPQPTTLQFFTDTDGMGNWAAEDLDAEGSVSLVVETERFFTFTTDGGWGGAWRPAEPNSGDDCVISEDGTVKANTTATNGCFKIATPGTYILTPDAATTSFTVTGFQGEVVYPETLYMIGYVNGMSFVHNTPGVASKAGVDGVYTWEGVTIGDPNAGTVDGDVFGYFNIATVVSETAPDWDSVINSGNRYGAPTKDAPLAPGTPAAVKIYKPEVDASSCESWKIAGNKTYDFTLDIPNLKISAVENTTGIADVEVENVAPVYYNLQGVRVMEPQNGIFIEVRGNKALKVVK